jgi:hypothetical protein
MGDFEVAVRRLDYKSKELTYREGENALVLYLEMTGFFAPYDYVGGTECFAAWTIPKDSPIETSHSHLIRTRIEGWTRKHGFKVGFQRPIGRAEREAGMREAGYEPKVLPDGRTVWAPGPNSTYWRRFWALWRRHRQGPA